MSAGRVVGTAFSVAAAVGVAAFTWGALIERNRYQIRQEIVPVLAPGARPITILHLSDLHMAPWQRDKQDWIARIASITEPDFVVSTGDLLGHEDGLVGIRRAFAPFLTRRTPGAFVHGSNDYYAPRSLNPFSYFAGPSGHGGKGDGQERQRLDTGALEAFLAELGWTDVAERATALELRGSLLELIGVDDPHLGLDRLGRLPQLVEEMREHLSLAEEGAATSSGNVTLALTHAPYRRILDAFTTQGADLIFAGHTHGGQVRIPGLPALVTNCDIPREQAQGLSTWTHARHCAWLEVSAGIGTSIYAPVRFACPPEAVVLTLVAAPDA